MINGAKRSVLQSLNCTPHNRIRIMKLKLVACALVLVGLVSCSKSSKPSGGNNGGGSDTTAFAFTAGADVSWVTQMEASGLAFYDTTGTVKDLFVLLKEKGINAIRLRVWVNPSGGYCNTADVVSKALRAKAAGMNILIDFHYSDTWADPGDQTVPAAWANLSFSGLDSALGAYTKGVLDTLQSNGITPTWVQVGNEVSNGMCWPMGQASTNMAQFATLVTTGYHAVKSVFPKCKVIVHLANGYDNAVYRWLFDGLKANGATWDVIGMSMYPTDATWQSQDSLCLVNMQDMISRYGSQVMICEAGYAVDEPTTANAFLTDLITKTRSVTGGIGVLYWEPEAYNGWQGYQSGAFNQLGRPTDALNAFLSP